MILADVIGAVLLVLGAAFCLVAAIGIHRLPDVYSRMHAASKAGTLGGGLMLLAVAIESLTFDVITRALAGLAFLLLTTPVSAHLLARAAYMAGYPPAPQTGQDDLKGRYRDGHLTGPSPAEGSAPAP